MYHDRGGEWCLYVFDIADARAVAPFAYIGNGKASADLGTEDIIHTQWVAKDTIGCWTRNHVHIARVCVCVSKCVCVFLCLPACLFARACVRVQGAGGCEGVCARMHVCSCVRACVRGTLLSCVTE